MIHRISINTKAQVEFLNITGIIQDALASSGMKNGMCLIFVPHTTASITINEQADPDVVKDIITHLDAIVPQHSRYLHTEGNSPAHIKASLFGNSETLVVENGRLVLGTWQGVFLCEFDGPRSRSVIVKIMSD